MKYDYFIGGRWRNRDAIQQVLDAVRASGKTAYCFIENSWDDESFAIDASTSTQDDIETFMQSLEKMPDWQTNPTFKAIFEKDMEGLRAGAETIIVFPAGLAAHMELGAAYGLGKKCYGIGAPEKNETLYLMFDELYPDLQSFIDARLGVKA